MLEIHYVGSTEAYLNDLGNETGTEAGNKGMTISTYYGTSGN